MGLKKEKLLPYDGPNLQAFNDTVTCPWGYVKLKVALGEGQNVSTIYA